MILSLKTLRPQLESLRPQDRFWNAFDVLFALGHSAQSFSRQEEIDVMNHIENALAVGDIEEAEYPPEGGSVRWFRFMVAVPA